MKHLYRFQRNFYSEGSFYGELKHLLDKNKFLTRKLQSSLWSSGAVNHAEQRRPGGWLGAPRMGAQGRNDRKHTL